MHEASLARDLLGAVLGSLPAGVLVRVTSVRGWVGETEALSPDSLRFHFAAFAHGTPAEGASLDLRVEHIEATCNACGATYLPEHHLTICPHCGSTDGEILGEPGVKIEEIDVVGEEGDLGF